MSIEGSDGGQGGDVIELGPYLSKRPNTPHLRLLREGESVHRPADVSRVDFRSSAADVNFLMKHFLEPQRRAEVLGWGGRNPVFANTNMEWRNVERALVDLEWQRFVVGISDDVSRRALCAADAAFDILDYADPTLELTEFDYPSFEDRATRMRWFALSLWPAITPNAAGSDRECSVLVQPGYLRWSEGWYFGSPDMDNCGPVSPWTVVRPNGVNYDRFK